MHIRGGHGKGEQQLTALGTGRWTGREAADPGAPRGTSRGGPTLEKPAPTRLPTPFLTTRAPAGLCLGDASGTRCPPQCSSASRSKCIRATRACCVPPADPAPLTAQGALRGKHGGRRLPGVVLPRSATPKHSEEGPGPRAAPALHGSRHSAALRTHD